MLYSCSVHVNAYVFKSSIIRQTARASAPPGPLGIRARGRGVRRRELAGALSGTPAGASQEQAPGDQGPRHAKR